MDSMVEDSLPVFVSRCKAPEYQAMYPFTHRMLGHCRLRRIVPHRCVRHLALIELNDKLYHQLPLIHNELLECIVTARVNETHTCNVQSELQEAALNITYLWCSL